MKKILKENPAPSYTRVPCCFPALPSGISMAGLLVGPFEELATQKRKAAAVHAFNTNPELFQNVE